MGGEEIILGGHMPPLPPPLAPPLPSNFASMIRTMPLFLLSIIRRTSLVVLKEFRFFCDFKIFDVVKVLFWRNVASI